MGANPKISGDTLARLLDYDPATGVFKWKVRRARAVAGAVAGHVDARGFLSISVAGYPCGAHDLAWLASRGSWPPSRVEHANGDRLDNRAHNLRLRAQPPRRS